MAKEKYIDINDWDNLPNIDLGIDFSNDWIKLWEDFCRKNKLNVNLPYPEATSRDEQSTNAYVMLINIVRIKNNGWTPDWNNSGEYKYYPYFRMRTGKNGFAFGASDHGHAGTLVGSRLCFPSAELCEAVAKDFLPIYKIYFTNK